MPDVIALLEPSPELLAQRAANAEQRREKKLRRSDAEQQAALAEAASAPRPSEVLARAEREMVPGSHAARQQQLDAQARAAATSTAQEPGEFRQALAEARERQNSDSHDSAGRVPRSNADGTPAPAPNGRPAAGARPSEAATAGTSTPAQNWTAPKSAGAPSSGSENPARPPGSSAAHATPTPVSVASHAPQASVAGGKTVRQSAAGGLPATARVAAPSAAAGARGASSPTVAVASSPATSGSRRGVSIPKAQTTPEPESNSDANIERVLRWIHSRIGKDRSVATLRLDPPELGTVRLRLELRQDQLVLLARTDTTAAQHLLTENLGDLRRRLAASGIQLERVEIRPPEPPSPAPEQATPQHAQAWTGDASGGSREGGGSAGGGPSGDDRLETGPTGEWESPPAEAPASADAVLSVPAAETLVNVLA